MSKSSCKASDAKVLSTEPLVSILPIFFLPALKANIDDQGCSLDEIGLVCHRLQCCDKRHLLIPEQDDVQGSIGQAADLGTC